MNYLEVYRRDNVEAIGVRDNPITEIVPEGIKLADGAVHEVDAIIMAVGFDAGSGAMSRIDVIGRDGVKLAEEWRKDIRATLGMQKHGFPNLFITGGPLSPSAALCNMTTCLQQQTEWITDCIKHVRKAGKSTVEPSANMEDEWVRHHDETVASTLFRTAKSWYAGLNVEGKPKRFLSYTGGVGTYRQKCAEIAAQGYDGMVMS
jgi:cation diffusion facilitator CzcD-associated flavoprotein CzcO